MTTNDASSLLIFGYGNESRGDDALGPLLVNRIREQHEARSGGRELAFLDDYQIQIEHVMDLQSRCAVIMIDAAVNIDAPFVFHRLQAHPETSYTTHGMTPHTLLYQYQKVLQSEPPPVYMLAVQGYRFELGEQLSEQAERNFNQALIFVTALLEEPDLDHWSEYCHQPPVAGSFFGSL